MVERLRILHPKYVALFFVLFLFWCVAQLPRGLVLRVGRLFGLAIYKVCQKTRHVTSCNLKVCFPCVDQGEQKLMSRRATAELGISIFETFMVWFRDIDRQLAGRLKFEGLEHLQRALDDDRPIIVLSSHLGSVDLNGAIFSRLERRGRPFIATYRKTDSVVNAILHRVRGRFCDDMIPVSDQRDVVLALKNKALVWYAPDIESCARNTAFVKFMGVDASTTMTTARLAKICNAIVLPFAHYRNADGCYTAKVFQPLENFPSGDLAADTRRVNAAIEAMIQPQPESYWWAIKRYKNRPQGQPAIY